jgi:ribosome maturation factor RimP
MAAALADAIGTLLQTALKEDSQYFVVDITVSASNDIKIYIDGDAGVPIQKCVELSRVLYKHIEAANIFTNNNFGLEVSSAGLDKPLKLLRQYQKNIGKQVLVTTSESKLMEGVLTEVAAENITLAQVIGKAQKKETVYIQIAFDSIQSTVVQAVFK